MVTNNKYKYNSTQEKLESNLLNGNPFKNKMFEGKTISLFLSCENRTKMVYKRRTLPIRKPDSENKNKRDCRQVILVKAT